MVSIKTSFVYHPMVSVLELKQRAKTGECTRRGKNGLCLKGKNYRVASHKAKKTRERGSKKPCTDA